MFDIGFSKLLLTALVALLVLGPDKMPAAARTLGLIVGRLRRNFNELRNEFEKEFGTADLRRQFEDPLKKLDRQIRNELRPQASGSPQALNAVLQPAPVEQTPPASVEATPATDIADIEPTPAEPAPAAATVPEPATAAIDAASQANAASIPTSEAAPEPGQPS